MLADPFAFQIASFALLPAKARTRGRYHKRCFDPVQTKLAVYGMNRDHDKAALIEAILSQNFLEMDAATFGASFEPLYKTGKRDHVKEAWVVRVSFEFHTTIMATGRLYVS